MTIFNHFECLRGVEIMIVQKKTVAGAGLFALSWPIFIENALQMSMSFIDTLMLSYVSDDAVSAVGVASQAIMLAILLISSVTMGSNVVITNYLGAKQKIHASKASANSLSISLIIGIVLGLLFFLFTDEYLDFFSLTNQTQLHAENYLMIVGGLILFYALNVSAGAILRSHGYTKASMYCTLGISILNIVGNYLFIFGAFGFPKWDVEGVAIATAGSRFIGFLVMFVIILKTAIAPRKLKEYIHLKALYIRKMLYIGIPSTAEQLFFHLSQIVIMGMVTLLGDTALTTHIYVSNILMFVVLFNLSIAQGTQIKMGYLFGSNSVTEIYSQFYKSFKLGIITLIPITIILITTRNNILFIFTDDKHVVYLGASVFLTCILLEPGRALSMIIVHSLRAVSDVRLPAIISVTFMWGICMPLSYLLSFIFKQGLLGIWIALSLYEWLLGITLYIRWKKDKGLSLEIT